MKLIYPIKKNKEKIFEDIKNKITNKGGTLAGDIKKGTISLQGIKGNYYTDAKNLTVELTDIPFYFPESFIKILADEYFNSI